MSIDSVFHETLAAVEHELVVGLIATWDPVACAPDDPVQEHLELMRSEDFDRLLVRDRSGQLLGVFERDDAADLTDIRSGMKLIVADMLIPSNQPLEPLITSVLDTQDPRPFRIVLGPNGRQGILTRSDFHKLPVRMVAFSLVTHLELSMTELIQLASGGNDSWWLDAGILDEDRIEKIDKRMNRMVKNRVPPPSRIELAQFCDKRDILHKHDDLKMGRRFKDDLVSIEERIRNNVAHANRYAMSYQEFQKFAHYMKRARHWIKQIEKRKTELSS